MVRVARVLLFLSVSGLLWPAALAQQADSADKEQHVAMPIQVCTNGGGCDTEQARLTLDAEWRFIHDVNSQGSCGGPGAWNATLCPDGATCAKNCVLDGVTEKVYNDNYGIIKTSKGVRLNYMTGSNVGSRVYLMDGATDNYRMFNLKNREIAFDLDASQLECGMNAAMYFVEMPADGGRGIGDNTAGAKYGSGYCDARCPKLKFVDGKANMDSMYGSCCAELDVFEANRMAGALTVHPCNTEGKHTCQGGMECGDGDEHQYYMGVCDKDGCEFNPYRLGNHSFMGAGATVDLKKPVTVVTQFHTEDGTDSGALTEIRTYYVQDGKVIQNSHSMLEGIEGDSITDGFCDQEKVQYEVTRDNYNTEGAYNQFREKGGLRKIGEALDRGMVLALSIWDDDAIKMQWLDSFLPNDLPEGTPGALRGPCKTEWGSPEWMRENLGGMYATFENFQLGEIGSTAKDRLLPLQSSRGGKVEGSKGQTKSKPAKALASKVALGTWNLRRAAQQPASFGLLLGTAGSAAVLLAAMSVRQRRRGQRLLDTETGSAE